MNINKRKPLTSLEYAGMESLLDRIINAYEEYQGIPEYDRTPAKEVSRRAENGMETFEHMKEFAAEIPVIFLTASGEVGDVVGALLLGAVDYLRKPYRPQELLKRVAQEFEKK